MALRAIAAMSLNRVIGKEGKIPWHLPEDFKWFKQATTGQAVLMGRKTFESIGRPLPNRRNFVVTRSGDIGPGVEVIRDLESFRAEDYPCDVWVIGGAEIYRLLLGKCEELYLTLVPREVEGDIYFPEFEDQFDLAGTVLEKSEFKVLKYVRKRS